MRSSLFFFLFFVNIFFFSCSDSSHSKTPPTTASSSHIILSFDEKQWMEKFFRDFFLEDSNQVAIYTLFGTKPMSAVQIIYRTEEDWKAVAKYFTKERSPEIQKRAIKEAEKCYQEYDLHINWDKWISFIKRYPQSPFLFSKRSYPPLNPRGEAFVQGLIINIQEVIWSLQHHYDLFKKELGRDFSPIEETLDFENSDSLFWNDVFSNTLLQGILYGYGEKNSYFFASAKKWEEKGNNFYDTKIFASAPTPRNEDDSLSIKNIGFPLFRSYLLPFNEDPVRLKYIEERKNMQKHLNDENFFEKTLNQLVGNLEGNF